MYETLIVETDRRGVARITLNRPEAANALNDALLRDLKDAFHDCGRDLNVRVIVLTGTGKAFCAGGDLAWMQAINNSSRSERVLGSRAVADMLYAADTVGKPVVARVNGAAFGGGVGLACTADAVVAAQSASFALSEVRLGLVPANIGPYVVRRMGASQARRYALSGRRFSAMDAQKLGIVHEVVADEQLEDAVEREVATFLEAAPEAISITKSLIAYVDGHSEQDNILYTADRLADAWETECGREGIKSFLGKTVPSWRA
ncbi:methylglutaconyl-CoA hydratase [Bosea sp. TND4EK4]|nr:methylglutaconyl-CoA hydratase [Bosea sp. TND4EK4]